ncbi:SMP-30/gluconolactonase/LRE family protein [Mycolicibacterium nivoides]|uniref:SMP-30/gluconolactonase/LRE family protein n=1 Tax=Mycolicibacterium nivoides TaxID=2487344 RepID=UPI000F5C1A33|nr:SMP-30/gluconolactonase/LRE family protein [Mycolicibacterium septicum]
MNEPVPPVRTLDGETAQWHVAVQAGAELGEHPLWDVRSNRLIWTDCVTGKVHSSGGCDDTVIWSQPEGLPIGVTLLRANGGLAVATGQHIVLLDGDGRPDRGPIYLPIDIARVRFNDGSCDPAGRLLVGTTGGNVVGLGELFSVSVDGHARRLLGDLTESNGIGWSPDGRRMYFIDSGQPVVYVYEYDLHTGGLGQRQEFATIDPALGYLDGLTVDRSGDVWVAVWEGGHLRRYSPNGRLRDIFALPVSHPTCPAFGGAALDTLFVTSARVATAIEDEEPWAGHVLAWFGAGRGIAPHRYGG